MYVCVFTRLEKHCPYLPIWLYPYKYQAAFIHSSELTCKNKLLFSLFFFKECHLYLQVQRVQMDSHLQSATRLHLDLACVKLTNTEAKLIDTEAKLNDAHMKLNKTEEKLEATRKVVEKLETRMFTWRINNFSGILRRAKIDGKLTSVPFYTDRTGSYGYKLKAGISPNDYWLFSDRLKVFIVLMKGEYDAILPWPFKNRLKVTLIDQQEDPAKRENITRELININGVPRAATDEDQKLVLDISHETLHSRRYLEDDTLFLQFEISPP